MNAVESAAPAPTPAAEPTTALAGAPVTLTLFHKGEKAHGFRSTMTWERFYTKIACVGPAKTKDKLELPGWSAATFTDNHRALPSVESVAAVVLDFDNLWKPNGAKKAEPLPVEKRTTPEAAIAVWSGTSAFFYTSWSHTKGLPKFRLVLPLSRPVTAEEFKILWQHVAAVHERAGHVVDPQCKDASHLWFFGARRNEDYATGMQEGDPLDVENVLVAASVVNDVTVDDERGGPSGSGAVAPTSINERASRYLAKMPEAISGSGGHTTTFKAALVLVRGFGLAAEDAVDMLMQEYNPRCDPPWTEKELRHKVEDAAKLHDPPVGYLLKPNVSAPRALAAVLAGPTTSADTVIVEDSHDLPFTDDGNALRLVAAFKDVTRYVIELKSFIRWNGKVWERDHEAHLVREDMRCLARRWADAAVKIPDDEARKRALAWAHKSQASARLEAAVELAKGDARIRVHVAEIDAHPYLLNVQNGIVDLRDIDSARGTCKLLPHDPKYMLTRITRFGYVPTAPCPTWSAFCTFSASGDDEVEAYRRRRRGSYLCGSPDKVFEIAFGTGDTGKTTYYATIANVMGDYAEKVDKRVFEKQRSEQHPNHLMELEGLRFAYGAEIEGHLDIQQVKDLTGERKIKARGMRENMRSLARHYKLAIFANDAPKIRRTNNDPIWNRIHADAWKAVIVEKKAEAEIDETYAREGEGILADIVRGWIDFWQHGLAPPKVILDVTRKYSNDEDPVQEWIDECCDVTDAKTETRFNDLAESRAAWLRKHDPERDESSKAFAKLLETKGFAKGKDTTGAAVRIGIKLKASAPATTTGGMVVEDAFDMAEMLDRAAADQGDQARNDLLESV